MVYCNPEDKIWQLEYHCDFPNVLVSFTVKARNFEEATRLGDQAIQGLQRTAAYQKTY